MRRVARYSLRFLLVLVVGFVLTAVLPLGPAPGPYVSALADLAVGNAHADPSCPNKGCPLNPTGNCSHKEGFAGCALIGGVCDDRMCP